MTAINPLISVLMPVYNAERYLREAVDSVLGQTFGDFELIAVDDGSTDGSLAILREYERRDKRMKVVTGPNRRQAYARNVAFQLSKGALIACMDADDVSLPHRFAAQVAEFERRPSLVMLGSAALCTDPSLMPVRVMCTTRGHEALLTRMLDGDGFAILHPTVMMRRAALVEAGGWDVSYLYSEDVDLHLRMSELGEVDNYPDVLLKYRMHPESTMNRPNRALEFGVRAVAAAKKRRKLTNAGQVGCEPMGRIDARLQRDSGSRHKDWAWSAWVSGFDQTARFYARRTWWSSPLSWDAWKLLLVTHLKRPVKPATTNASGRDGADPRVVS